MSSGGGFDVYERFFRREPAVVVEWHDDRTPARGWLCMNSLRGGAAGGGTRMRPGGTREEAVFLAKTMEVKFNVAGPPIGGGKSVIDFDGMKNPDQKRGVLERWYRHVGPYLKACYGTGGDVGVDEVSEATAIIEDVVGLKHPQAGIAIGHFGRDGEGPQPKIDRLKRGVEARVVLPDLPGPRDGAWMVADVATGLGVAASVECWSKAAGRSLEGARVIIEGFGAVGAFAAYYLARQGARIVAASSRSPRGGIRVAVNPRGFDVLSVISRRDDTSLPDDGGPGTRVSDSPAGDGLFSEPAEVFIPAATSHTISAQRLAEIRRAGVKVLSCGANNPFAYQSRPGAGLADWVADMLAIQREADQDLAIIPDFIANSGMARTFAYLMSSGGVPEATAVLADLTATVARALDRLLASGPADHGLLERGYRLFVRD